MIANLQPYPTYRSPGIPWLGDVPEHWEVKRLKAAGRIRYGLGQPPQESQTGLPLIRATNVSRGRIVDKDLLYIDPEDVPVGRNAFLREKEIIVVRSGAYTADSAIVHKTYAGSVAGYDMVLTVTGAIPEFIAAALLAGYLRDDQLVVASTRAAQPHLNAEELGTSVVLLPPLAEQAAIVRFLDHADEQIQRYIAAKGRLIVLLEEQRKAVVHQTVTRGLDPNVRLKDSGVEWLGCVPEHWEICKLRHHTSASGGSTPSMEVHRFWGGSVPWVTPKDMKQDVISDSSMKVTNAAIRETSLQLIKPPVVLMVVRGMILARRVPIAYTTTPVTINQDMKALRTLRGTNAIFLAYSLNSAQEALRPLIDEAGHGTRRLPVERWRELPITMPPPSEQHAIIEYLDNTTADINAAIDRAHRQIELINEFRSRLIADVVTGQLDVRQAAEQLADPGNANSWPGHQSPPFATA